jgi:hypothetical protein
VITPNGDGSNDAAKFQFRELELFNPTLKIFDMRGVTLYTVSGDGGGNELEWNGLDDHRNYVLPGVYLWILQDGSRRVGSGYVTVIR